MGAKRIERPEAMSGDNRQHGVGIELAGTGH
ncbi:hypothetical protein V475_03995 [Sphingobium baderi LL03]|jgi:hypothetical protein|uniref:Uncharacterized protein n=1 Tax=Sphingobium baderi LL03 TaxID=1114964 RepID=T0IA22_9SPHN|nr:hypothetical protein L485_00435 [Sphingobium baderi LL03]KMS62994.1 hypothetical protein V475_03995 [Sphingobium baderi LL03]